MAESELNFDAPLLSTRRLKKTPVSVRTNKLSESHYVPVLVQDMCLDHIPESASVPSQCQPINENLTRLHSSESKHVEKEGEASEDDDDDDDAFSDARDTMFVEAMTPSRPSEDSQPRDFMLYRFLPAAKSLTVEKQPQYALKRQPLPLISEPMIQIRDIVPAETPSTPKRYESFTTPSYFQDRYDEESEDDDDEYLSKRGCGMMSPQLCFKNSLGMLSSVHGLKEKPSSQDQVKSSKVAQLKSRFQSVKKLALDKLGSRAQSPLHAGVGRKFNCGSEQLESNLSTASRPSSPYRQTGCMSPYRTVGNISPLRPSGFPGTRKEAEIMRANRLNKHIRNNCKSQELLYPKSTRLDCSTSSVREKTLYVDTQNCPNTRNNKGNSYIKISPETVEAVSEEQEITPKDLLKLQAVETLTTSSVIKKMETDESEKNSSGCDLPPLVPPSPKKPSDSWLSRNLPSLSSKIPSRIHHLKKELEENSTSVTKWETIVKTSCIHRDHIRYSEELVSRSSCQF